MGVLPDSEEPSVGGRVGKLQAHRDPSWAQVALKGVVGVCVEGLPGGSSFLSP